MSSNELVLAAEKREVTGKGPARRLRSAGRVPGVVYGHGKNAIGLSLKMLELAPHIHHGGLLKLKLAGRTRGVTAIIKAVQFDAIRGDIQHVDFQEVRADEIVSATVGLVPHGTPAGQSLGGMLEQALHELDVKCPANKLPEELVVDVSGMGVDDTLHIKDLDLPEGVVAELDGEQLVFQVRIPRVDEAAEDEEEGEEQVDVEGGEEGQPEVITRGKKEEEGEE